jgi:hypothetical protein
MENRWLIIWLLAPLFSPASLAIESYSLHWYRLESDTPAICSGVRRPDRCGPRATPDLRSTERP